MGVAERYEQIKKQNSAKKTAQSGVESRYKSNNAANVAKDIQSRLTKLGKDSQSLLDGYNSRFFNKDGKYITDVYRSSEDAGNWLYDVETQRETLETEGSEIKKLLADYGEYFDKDMAANINSILDGNVKVINGIVSNSLMDKEYWDKFEDENAWKTALQKQKDLEEYAGVVNNTDFSDVISNSGNLYTVDTSGSLKEIADSYETLRSEEGFNDQNMVALYFDITEKYPELLEGKSIYDIDNNIAPGEAKNFDGWIKGIQNDGLLAFVRKKGTSEDDLPFIHISQLTKDERDIFNYLYTTKGLDEAELYLANFAEELSARKGKYDFDKIKGDTLAEIWYGVEAGLKQWESGWLEFMDGMDSNYAPHDSSHFTSQYIREDLGAFGRFLFDLSQTTGNQIPAMAMSALMGRWSGRIANAVMMGGSAAGNTYIDAYNMGYSKEQAKTYGILVGAAEAGLEFAMDGFTKSGGALSGHAIQKFSSKISSGIGKFAIKMGGTMLSEGIEEYAAEVLDTVWQNIAFDTEKDIDFFSGEAFYAALLGAVSAGGMGGVNAISSVGVETARDELIRMGKQMPTNTQAYQLATEFESKKYNLKPEELQKLSDEICQTKAETNRQIFNGIRQALIEQGETGDIDAIASAAVNTMTGAPLTETEKALIMNSKLSPTDGTETNDSITATAKMYEAAGVSPEQALEMAKEQFPNSSTEVMSPDQNATEGKFEVSDDGKTVKAKTGDAVEVVNISGISDSGEVDLTLKDGTVVKASDISFGNPAEAAFVGYISELKLGKNAISAETANDLYQAAMSALRSNPKMTVSEASSLIRGLAEAYTYGAYSFGEERLTETDENGKAKRFAGELTDTQRRFAYKLGKKDRVAKVEAEQKAITEAKGKAKPSKKHLGKIVFEDGINVNESDLSDFQKANLEGIKLLAEISSIEFHIYQTEKVNGKWQYTMADGTVVGANGWYVAGTNEIWVDLNAGEFGEGAMIRTAAHEISHYIKDKSPKQWQAMADLLMQTFAENDVDVESMLNRQIAKIKRRHKSNKDAIPSQSVLREMAYEELVSDALSDMLTDGSIVNFIAEVKTKDQSLGKRILEAIRNLLKKWGLVVDSYKGKDLDTAEAQALSQFEDTFKKLQEMYQEALMDADKVYNQIEEKLTKEIKFLDRNSDYKNFSADDYYTNGKIYSYEFLTSQNEMTKVKLPNTGALADKKGKIDDEKVVDEGIKNALSEGVERDGKVYVKNAYTGREMRIDNSTIKHGLDGTYNRHLTNARIGSVIGSVVKNAIPINGLKNTSSKAIGTYAMVSYCYDGLNRQFIAVITVEQHTGDIDSFELYDVAHAVSGRQKKSSQVDTKSQGVYPIEATTISISDLLKIVNSTHQSILSDDVLSHLGETRNLKGSYSDKVLFSDRDSSTSTRSLLANALEGAVQNDIERNKLGEYKEKIALLDSEQQKLTAIQKQLFTKGAVDPATRKKLQLEAKQISNRINIYDRQLLNLEATKALKNVLEREKARARKRQKEIDNMILQGQKDKAAAKQRELMDRYKESRRKATESRHRTAMRHKIKNVVSELNQLLLKGSKERNVKLGLQSAVASALDAINMDTVAADERIAKLEQELKKAKTPEKMQEISRKIENIRAQGDKMASKLEALKKAYEKIKTNSEDAPDYFKAEAGIIEERIASVIDIVGDTPLRNMSLYQLEAVHDLYSMVLATVRNANSVFLQGKLEDLQQNATATMEEISAIKTLSEERIGMGWLRSFSWNEMVPIYAFRRMGSKTFEKFFWEAIKGQNTVARDLEEANNFAKETRSKYNYNKWDLDKVHEFKLADGRTFRVTLRHMMSIYAYSKREQALDHMAKGGFFFNDKATFRKKGGVINLIKSNEVGYSVDLNTLQAIANEMTSEQLQYVDKMQDYLTQMGRKGNEVSRVLWGIDIFKEKVYFPLKSVKDFIFQTNQTVQESSLKNDGMTKETKPHASNPIVLEAFDDVWASHVNRMSQYHGLVLPIENLNKIHSYGTWANSDSVSVSTMLRARFGEAVNDYINQFIKDLNGASSTSGASNPFFGLVGKFKKTAVAASMSVVAQQPTAILRAMAVMDTKYFIGLPEARLLKTKWNEVKKHAPIAIIKEIGGFDAGAGRQATEWLNSDTLKGLDKVSNTIDDVTMKGAAIGDQVGWCTIWEAVKREIKATTDLKVGSDEFLNAVGERFTEIIVLTQVYDSTLSRSGFMRSKHDSVKMLTSFMGEPTVSFNMLYDATIQAKRKTITKRKAGRIVGSVYASVIAASIAASLIYALRDDDEDESYAEKFAEAFGDKLLDDINPLNMLPGVRDIVSILDGWDVERTDMAIFKDIKDAFDGLASENKSSWKKVEDFAGAVASLFGVPLKNLLRTGREFYNAFENIFDGISPSGVDEAFIRGLTGEKKDKGKALYDAIVNGDDARVEVYRKGYKDEKAYETALRKALRENDPRIKEAAKALFEGDVTEYDNIANEIVNEGYFDIDDVKATIKSEYNALKPDEDDDNAVNEEESIYYSHQYYDALIAGDLSMADKVKQDIIRVEIANGEDPEDAEKSFYSSFRTDCRDGYAEGKLSYDKTMDMLIKHGGLNDDDAYWKMKEFDYYIANGSTDGYSKYNDFYEAVKTGKNIKKVIKEYIDHGVKEDTLASQITSHYKPLYIKMTNTERAGIKGYLLNAYMLLGKKRSEKSKDIDKWLKE